VLVLRESELPGPDARDVRRALVVAEILSPSTAARDRGVKVETYLARGVEEVWLLDPATETVEIRRKGKGGGAGEGSRALPGFDPAAVFARG
jgi:Uma2 family endonuclease